MFSSSGFHRNFIIRTSSETLITSNINAVMRCFQMGLIESIGTDLIQILSWFPDWFIVVVISMLPIFELRGTIILWGSAGLFPEITAVWQIYLLAVIGNLIPVPFILLFFPAVEKWLRRFKKFNEFFDWLFARTRKKAERHVRKYQELALVIFVAIPLPITGAWTGSLIAYLFDLKLKSAFVFIACGVLIAGLIMLVMVKVNLYIAILLIVGLVIASFIIAKS